MARRKKKRNTNLLELGLTTGVGGFAIGALPSNASTSPIKASVTGGFSKFSTVFPIAFKLKAGALVLKTTGGLIKATKKLKSKRRRR